MIIIDAELYNPKVDGKTLLIDGKINPEIGISRENIVAGENIIIDQINDGTIRISANVQSSETSYEYFSTEKSSRVFETMPSESFYFVFSLLYGITINSELLSDYVIDVVNYDILKPTVGFSYDLSGNAGVYEENVELGTLEATMSLKGIEYSKGQGGEFSIDYSSGNRVLSEINIASDSNFLNIVLGKKVIGTTAFVSFNSIGSGTYYWRMRTTEISTLNSSAWDTDSFTFTYQDPPYAEDSCPFNLTSNTSDSNWTISSSGASNDTNVYQAFSSTGITGWSLYWSSGGYLQWERTDSKPILIKTVKILALSGGPPGTFNFSLQGSDDGTSWTEITNGTISYNGVLTSYTSSNTTAYDKIRMTFTGSWCYPSKIEAYKE